MQKVCRSASSLHEAKKTKQQTNDMNERCFFIANLKFNCKVNKIFHEHKEIEKKRGGSPHLCKEPPLSRRRRPTLPHCGAVPSARPGLTSLFGMGRGGTPGPKPPEYDVSDIDRKQKRERPEEKTRTPALADMRKTHGADTSVCAFTGKAGGLLVLLGCGRRRPCTCSLSTSSSLTAL